MFKNLLSVLKKGDLVSQALKDTDIMFNKSKQLFNEAVTILAEKRDQIFDLYALDREINSLEKEIRRKILESLSINPRQDIVASLVLTSIIIDIERIGDYSKNIYELRHLCTPDIESIVDLNLMKNVGLISEKFSQLGKSLSAGDEVVAKLLLEELDFIKKYFDTFICEIADALTITQRKAVVNVLFARYLKRVTAHLGNIASSISNPFDMIGFYQNDSDKEVD